MEVPDSVSAKKRKRSRNSGEKDVLLIQERRRQTRERVRRFRQRKEALRRRQLLAVSSESESEGNKSDSQLVTDCKPISWGTDGTNEFRTAVALLRRSNRDPLLGGDGPRAGPSQDAAQDEPESQEPGPSFFAQEEDDFVEPTIENAEEDDDPMVNDWEPIQHQWNNNEWAEEEEELVGVLEDQEDGVRVDQEIQDGNQPVNNPEPMLDPHAQQKKTMSPQ